MFNPIPRIKQFYADHQAVVHAVGAGFAAGAVMAHKLTERSHQETHLWAGDVIREQMHKADWLDEDRHYLGSLLIKNNVDPTPEVVEDRRALRDKHYDNFLAAQKKAEDNR